MGADDYLNRHSFHLIEREDTFLRTAIWHRTKAKEAHSHSHAHSSSRNVTTSSRDESHGGGGKF